MLSDLSTARLQLIDILGDAHCVLVIVLRRVTAAAELLLPALRLDLGRRIATFDISLLLRERCVVVEDGSLP